MFRYVKFSEIRNFDHSWGSLSCRAAVISGKVSPSTVIPGTKGASSSGISGLSRWRHRASRGQFVSVSEKNFGFPSENLRKKNPFASMKFLLVIKKYLYHELPIQDS